MKTTYEDAAHALQRRARGELLAIVADNWAAAKEQAKTAEQAELDALNHLRAAGVAIEEITGREKISVPMFASLRDELPADMTYSAVRFCASLANQFPQPATTLEESRNARRAVFQQLKIEPPASRPGLQLARENNAWSDFVSGSLSFDRLIKPLEREQPMEQWTRTKLQTFVRATKGIVEKHHAAEKLLLK